MNDDRSDEGDIYDGCDCIDYICHTCSTAHLFYPPSLPLVDEAWKQDLVNKTVAAAAAAT